MGERLNRAPIGGVPSRLVRAPSTERLVSRRGGALLVLVALASYGVQALAWPLERGRDSWDYWLWFLQAGDSDPPFSALQVFRTPVAPLVTGIPMWLGGARLTEVVFAWPGVGQLAAQALSPLIHDRQAGRTMQSPPVSTPRSNS